MASAKCPHCNRRLDAEMTEKTERDQLLVERVKAGGVGQWTKTVRLICCPSCGKVLGVLPDE